MDESLKKLIHIYDETVKNISSKAKDQVDKDKKRAYGGIVRASKGSLVEFLAKELIKISWTELNQKNNRLAFITEKLKISVEKNYLEKIEDKEVKEYIQKNITKFYYGIRSDIHVFIDEVFVMAIECKAYTENAMLKRILVDFTLLKKSLGKELDFILFQLESQLTGDYSHIYKDKIFGSPSTHTIISQFDIQPTIITLLEGERGVNKAIHEKQFFKYLEKKSLIKCVDTLKNILQKYI
jgi:hypothetical protein